MRKNRIIYKVLLFCVLVIALGACKSKKQIVSNDGSLVQKTQQQLLNDVLNSQVNYKTISGKISLEMISGNKTSGMKVGSRLKIIKDDIIQLSILAPFINSEVFRMNITPDSVYVIDRMAKKYAVADIRQLEKQTKVQFNYYNMQSMFTNGLFMPGKKEVGKSDYDAYAITQNAGKYHLQTKDRAGVNYYFIVDANDRIESTNFSVERESKYSLQWSYEDFVKDNSYIYPTKMTAKVGIKNKQMSLIMTYSGLDIDKELNVDKSLPSKYERVSIMDILKNYIK